MYDNLHMRLTTVGADTSTVVSSLRNAKQNIDIETGECRTFGYLNNLRISVYESGLYIVGSLAKYFNGGNIYTLNRKTTEQAIQKLSDELRLDISTAKVTYLEFGDSFIMEHGVEEYLKRLSAMPRMARNQQESTLYFQTKGIEDPKKFVFYDKETELRKRKESLPDGFRGLNILRYEMRFKNRLPQQIGWPEVTASTLYNREFYRKMLNQYQQNYFSITKRKTMRLSALQAVSNPKEAFDCLVGMLISQAEPKLIEDFIGDLTTGTKLDRVQLYRLGKMVERVSTKGKLMEQDPLISELDNHIQNVGIYI